MISYSLAQSKIKQQASVKKMQPDSIPAAIDRLRELHPDAGNELKYDTPLQLLIATILSAQCADYQVNKITPKLFEKYPTVHAFANANRGELEMHIRSTGFYRQKAKFIQETCRILISRFDGKIPREMNLLTQLPGVARKTANLVLGEIYGMAEGIAVDTNVHRVANRLGWSQGKNAVKVESDLIKVIPRKDWIDISHILIFHGNRICQARQPLCSECPLSKLCPSSTV